ncbi:MAG: CARDB domain-containing protein, partial [Candidatus Caldarchaeum sp.]
MRKGPSFESVLMIVLLLTQTVLTSIDAQQITQVSRSGWLEVQQQEQFDFRIRAEPSSATVGSQVLIKGRICPTPLIDEGTYLKAETTVTRPDGGSDTMLAGLGRPQDTCSQDLIVAPITANMAGTWSVSSRAYWRSGGSRIEVTSNTITFTITTVGFTISLSALGVGIYQGESGQLTVNVESPSPQPYDVSLLLSGIPTGVSATLNPQTGRPPFSSTLRLTVSQSAAPGTYRVTVTGNGGGHTSSASFDLFIHQRVQQDPALTDVGISGADYSVPRQPPTTVSPGGRFRAWYWVNNPNNQRVTVVLGLSIRAPNGQVFHDPSNDVSCELAPQQVTICNRFFTVPSNAPAGTYDVIYGLWTADRSRQITQVSRSGWLVVQQVSFDVQPRVWSPTVQVGSSASQSFTVSASGGTVTGITISRISGPSWITINPTSLGDIAAGQSKTFTLTVSPPSGAGGQHPYTIRISSTNAGSVDISGTITVQQQEQFDFRVRIPEATKYVVAGSGTIYTIWVDLVSGSAQQVTLSVSGLPSGVTYAFGSSSGGQLWTGVPAFSVDLYINTPSSLPPGTYSFTVTGSGGGLTRSASASLVVQAGTLDGRIVSVSPTSVTANPGQSVSFNFVVENTGNVIADYHVYFSASSILGYVSGTITLNPGQQGTITLTGNVPSGAGPGTYQVDVYFQMAYRGQGWQNAQRWGSVQITVQGPQPGYTKVTIVNNDDDPIDVHLYIDGRWKGSYFGRAPGSSTTTDPIPVEGNSNHEVKIIWRDPDTSSQYEKAQTVYVSEGQTLHLTLTIDPHAPPPARKPDLRITRVDLSPYREGNRYLQGEALSIYPTIVNEGNADASNFKVNWYVDDVLIHSWPGWSLRAGESVSSLGLNWSATPGTHVIRVVVDPDNLIDELDETDNQMSVTILVEPQPQCDFSISVSPTSGSVQQGRSITFTVTVGLVSGSCQPVSLSLAGQHPSMTYSFEPSIGTPAFISRLTITTSSSTPPNQYTLNVVGTSGGLTRSATIGLSVTTPEPKHKLRIAFPTIPATIQTNLYVNGDSRRVSGGETLELTVRKGEKVTLRTDPVPGYYSVSWIFKEPDDLPPWNGEKPLELIVDKDYTIAFIYSSVAEVEEIKRV